MFPQKMWVSENIGLISKSQKLCERSWSLVFWWFCVLVSQIFLSLLSKILKLGSHGLLKSQIYHSIPLLKREDSKVKLNKATRCWLRSFGQINEWYIFFSWSSMYVYSIKDSDSLCFMECTSIKIHRTVFQQIMIHRHQKWSITASRN